MNAHLSPKLNIVNISMVGPSSSFGGTGSDRWRVHSMSVGQGLDAPYIKGAAAYAVLTAALFSASSSAPTPVYRLYQAALGFSPLTLTIIFAAYAFSLLAALLTVGSLSDFVGRRPMIFGALVLNAAAMLTFVVADSTALLLLARLLQGFATGAAAATLGATILDLDKARGPLLNSVSPFIGLTAGALVSGTLVTYAPWPTELIYVVILASSLLLTLPLWRMRETVNLKAGAWASMRPHLTVQAPARQALLKMTPANIATWALGGFYFSLMPSLVAEATGFTTPFVGGLVVAALPLTASLSVLSLRRAPTARTLTIGTSGLALGVAVILMGTRFGFVPLLLAGTLISGVGFGATFSGTLQTILPLATSNERAGLVSAFYVESYLAFSLPVIVCGLSIPVVGLLSTAYGYGVVVILLALASLVATATTLFGIRRAPASPENGPSWQPLVIPKGTVLEEILHLIKRRAVELAGVPALRRERHYEIIRRSCVRAALQMGQDDAAATSTAEKMVEFARAAVAIVEAGSAKRKSS